IARSADTAPPPAASTGCSTRRIRPATAPRRGPGSAVPRSRLLEASVVHGSTPTRPWLFLTPGAHGGREPAHPRSCVARSAALAPVTAPGPARHRKVERLQKKPCVWLQGSSSHPPPGSIAPHCSSPFSTPPASSGLPCAQLV